MNLLSPLVIIGPSGSGKSTIANHLENTGKYTTVRTYTTRPRRINEDDSTHFFVTNVEFETLKKSDTFSHTATLFNYSYAIPAIVPSQSRPLIILRAQHVPIFKKAHPDCIVIQLTAPIPVLIKRIMSRGDLGRVNEDDFESEIELGQRYAAHIIDATRPTKTIISEIQAITE